MWTPRSTSGCEQPRGRARRHELVVLLGDLDPDHLPAAPLISVITLAELSVGPLVADDARERAARQARLQEAESVFDPLPVDAAAARAFGRIAADVRRSGRTVQPRAFDALIAAVAVANALPLYTCNPPPTSRG